MVLFQILLDGVEPRDAPSKWAWPLPGCLLQSAGGEANRILLALSSMCIICPNRVSQHDWIIAVSLSCSISRRICAEYV